jgi:hypothetical protein
VIVTETQLKAAYERVRMADLVSKGAEQYAELASQDLAEARAALENLIKNYSREVIRNAMKS